MASKWSCLNPCLGGDIREDYNLENREQVEDGRQQAYPSLFSKFMLEQDFIEIPSFLEGNEERVDRGPGQAEQSPTLFSWENTVQMKRSSFS